VSRDRLFDLSGKVAVVTGGTRGIGAATAVLLAEYGADIVVAGRDIARLESVTESIRRLSGRKAMGVVADISREADVVSLVDTAMGEFGRIDILVNNAGGPARSNIETTSAADWDAVMSANLRGAFLCTREAGRHMLAQSRGAIVNISSLAGVNAVPFAGAYGAAKAGLQNFTQATSTAWASRGIRTNAIAVGVIAHESKVRSTEAVDRIAAATPMRRLGTPEEIASIVLFLVSDAASFVTGATILASGGMVDSAPTAS
jgi:NAD(P)-dependent dehydrogenase (short-subunit alcohol dehydrogenase family)